MWNSSTLPFFSALRALYDIYFRRSFSRHFDQPIACCKYVEVKRTHTYIHTDYYIASVEFHLCDSLMTIMTWKWWWWWWCFVVLLVAFCLVRFCCYLAADLFFELFPSSPTFIFKSTCMQKCVLFCFDRIHPKVWNYRVWSSCFNLALPMQIPHSIL